MKNIRFLFSAFLLVVLLTTCSIFSPTLIFVTTIHRPTKTFVPTATLTKTFSLSQIREVLSGNGFALYPQDEQFCGQPCKTYRNSKYNLIAFSYDNTSLAIGIKFIAGSGTKGSDQADLVFTILNSIYPTEVVKWTVDKMGELDKEPQTGLISRYYIHLETVPIVGGSGITIFITPLDNAPGNNNS